MAVTCVSRCGTATCSSPDAAHTVPPTGAKRLNLALADVKVLSEVLRRAVAEHDDSALSTYTERALL